jgi:hypothetical protein
MRVLDRLRTPMRLIVVAAAAATCTPLVAQFNPPGQVFGDVSGDWVVVTHEDTPSYGLGPELGDYAGLPINAAGRQKAESWDADVLSQEARQIQAHPVQYISNNRGPTRILKVLDPMTQAFAAYAFAGSFGRADRIVWMDGRPHPSKFSEHTWDGFSTGVFENGVLVVTTTHMKQGVLWRNGVPLSPYAKLVEHFARHGLYMTVSMWIDDPIYLEAPEMRTYTEMWNGYGNLQYQEPFKAGEEVSNKPLGWVPAWPLGTKHREFAETHGLPFEVTQGGVETEYPEYQLKIQQLMRAEAAAKRSGAAAPNQPGR